MPIGGKACEGVIYAKVGILYHIHIEALKIFITLWADLNSILKIRMKKIFLFIIACSFALSVIAHDSEWDKARTVLTIVMSDMNAKCPCEESDYSILDSVRIVGEDLILYYTVKDKEDMTVFFSYLTHKPELREYIWNEHIKDASEESLVALDALQKAKLNLVYRFTSALTRRKVVFTFVPEELAVMETEMKEAMSSDKK